MAIYTNTAEGGTNGVVASTANTGGASGTIFDQVTGAVTFASSAALHGTLGYTASTATQYTRWSTTDTTVLIRGYFRYPDITAGGAPIRIGLASGNVRLDLMTGANEGRVQLYSGSGLATSPAGPLLAPNVIYRFELYAKAGEGTGELRGAVYEGDSTTPWWDSGALTGRTVANPATFFFGKYDAAATVVHWDSVGAKTGVDAVWGAWPDVPPVAGPTITVSRPADNLVDLRSSTSGDASTLTHATPVRVSGPTLTATSLASGLWLFSQDSASDAVYTVRVTQADSQTATQDVTIPALVTAPAENVSAPLRLLSAPPSNNWG